MVKWVQVDDVAPAIVDTEANELSDGNVINEAFRKKSLEEIFVEGVQQYKELVEEPSD